MKKENREPIITVSLRLSRKGIFLGNFLFSAFNYSLYLLMGLLISAEGTQTPAGVRGRGDPAGASAPRRLPGTPAESEVPGAQINRHVAKPI
ncbi:hypothetical protein QF028_004538 [Neobacillus sp. B4I6]